MTAKPIFVLCAAVCVVAACNKQPELDVTAGSAPSSATAPATAPAPAIGPDAELPPGHPPLDGAGAPSPGLQSGHPPTGAAAPGGMPGMGLTAAPGGEGDQAISWKTPAGWVEETPANSVRRAQYRVPGAGGAGECVVFYFGPGQGGDPQSNAQRWASQFVDAKGAPASPRTRLSEVGGLKVLFVEAEGTYLQGAMTGAAVEPKADHALLAAVVEGPDAHWFFKLTGPKATLASQRAGFESMIGSIRPGSPPEGSTR